MLFKEIGLIDEEFKYRENMYVGTVGNLIAYIDDKAPDNADAYGEVYYGKGKVLMPGFYNAHGHSPMVPMRGYAENLPLQRWLDEYILPFEDQLYSEGVYWSTLLANAESIRNGIVSTTEMYYFVDDMARAVSTSGMKATLGRSVVNFGDPVEESYRLKEMCDAIEMYHGWADGRILTACDIHAEYTCDEPMMRKVAELAKHYDVGCQIHCAETEHEVEGCIKRHGMTPVEFLNDCGIFDQPTNAAHCVWLTDHDIEILRDKKVTVTSCPISNLKLSSGICNVQKLYDNDVNVAIGTDSVASNNSLNFFEELKTFALLGKLKSGPNSMDPRKVLFSATRAGAIAQGRRDSGLVKEGYKADIIVIDIDQPNMRPVHSVVNNLVYSAEGRNVVLTMVDGQVLYRDGEYTTIDIEKVIEANDRVKDKMLAGVKAAQGK